MTDNSASQTTSLSHGLHDRLASQGGAQRDLVELVAEVRGLARPAVPGKRTGATRRGASAGRG